MMTNDLILMVGQADFSFAAIPILPVILSFLGSLVRGVREKTGNAAEWAQVALSWIHRVILLNIFFIIIKTLSKPLYIVGIIVLLTYFPDTLQWIFMQIGLIQIKIFAILLNAVMPEIFAYSSGDITEWAQLWNSALTALPSQVVEVMQALDVASLMGIVTSCLTSGFVIRTILRINKRMGL